MIQFSRILNIKVVDGVEFWVELMEAISGSGKITATFDLTHPINDSTLYQL